MQEKIEFQQITDTLNILNIFKKIDNKETCKKNKNEGIDPIWVEYNDNNGVLKKRCMPLTNEGFYNPIVEKELCLKLKDSTNIYPKLNEFNISWDVIEKPKDFIIQPTSRYDPPTQHKFDMEYEELMSKKKELTRETFYNELKGLEIKYKPFQLKPNIQKVIYKQEYCSITSKK